MDGVQLPQGCRATNSGQFTFKHLPPKSFWHLLDQLRKDETLNCSCSQAVLLHSQSSVLTTKPAFTYSKLTIKTPERRRRRSRVFIVNFDKTSHHVLVFLLLTLRM